MNIGLFGHQPQCPRGLWQAAGTAVHGDLVERDITAGRLRDNSLTDIAERSIGEDYLQL